MLPRSMLRRHLPAPRNGPHSCARLSLGVCVFRQGLTPILSHRPPLFRQHFAPYPGPSASFRSDFPRVSLPNSETRSASPTPFSFASLLSPAKPQGSPFHSIHLPSSCDFLSAAFHPPSSCVHPAFLSLHVLPSPLLLPSLPPSLSLPDRLPCAGPCLAGSSGIP